MILHIVFQKAYKYSNLYYANMCHFCLLHVLVSLQVTAECFLTFQVTPATGCPDKVDIAGHAVAILPLPSPVCGWSALGSLVAILYLSSDGSLFIATTLALAVAFVFSWSRLLGFAIRSGPDRRLIGFGPDRRLFGFGLAGWFIRAI